MIYDEAANYAASYAFEYLTGDADVFYEAWKRHRALLVEMVDGASEVPPLNWTA
ncbi:hypothetical protein KV557_37940 [Kitasatospora aureofaciens]|uniref:hypothetical protein n=1 Tax=Kitasatospora aureofaciens TaxID=1894 RepID=UPI001C474661|nr:hypothetical protein [Kitasatospora aureofaciens]MBV6702818.1 hypothetical protein [Kitasatospora aureofaciens]